MKVVLLWVGKTSLAFVDEGIKTYASRIKHYTSFEIAEIKDIKKGNPDSIFLKKTEGEAILSKIEAGDHVILLDENGITPNSVAFSGILNKIGLKGIKRLVFVIGGAYGFSNEVYARANEKISLSKMTFSHQIVRVIFLEQLYRAFTILKGEAYHHS